MVERVHIDQNVLLYYVHKSKIPLEVLQSKVDGINGYLDGSKEPTFNQISKIAKIINVPTGLLLLNNTVDMNENILNFRTINSDNLDETSAELRDTISEMQMKQDFLREEIEDGLGYIGKFSITDNYMTVVKEIRSHLKIPVAYQKEKSNNILDYFRSKINDIGIFVFFNGKVKDNTHRILNVKEFRGFVLSDKKAPLIFINQKDSKSGQLFTLIHELVHLFIGNEGIYNVIETSSYKYDAVEAFVNKVTAEILVPKEEILKLGNVDIEDIYKEFPVSKFVIVRRLYDINLLSKKQYQEETDKLEKEFENIEKRPTSSGGNYNNNLKFRMDKVFFKYVENAVKQNRISYTDAFNIVGVGYKGYQTLAGGVT